MTLTVEVWMPPKISGSASGSSTERTIWRAGHAHAAGGVDRVAVDLAHADVGVGEDRRDRQQGERERHVPELRRGRKKATKNAISATLGTARPTFEAEIARNEPRFDVAEPEAERQRDGDRDRHRGDHQLQVVDEQRQVLAAADRAPPARDSSDWKMNSIALAEVAQEGERLAHCRPPAATA